MTARSDDAAEPGRDRLSRPLTILAARNVWRSIFSRSRVRGSSGSAPCSSICVKLEMPVSGVFTSCATPAASSPIDAIFSEICSCSSSCTRAVTSCRMTTVPTVTTSSPWDARSGTTATLTRRAASAAPERAATGTRDRTAPDGDSRRAARTASRNGASNSSSSSRPIASCRVTP